MDTAAKWTVHILAQIEHPMPGYWKKGHPPLPYLCGKTTEDTPYDGWDFLPRERTPAFLSRHEYCIKCLARVGDKKLLLAMRGEPLW